MSLLMRSQTSATRARLPQKRCPHPREAVTPSLASCPLLTLGGSFILFRDLFGLPYRNEGHLLVNLAILSRIKTRHQRPGTQDSAGCTAEECRTPQTISGHGRDDHFELSKVKGAEGGCMIRVG